jgi:hypothetical protein
VLSQQYKDTEENPSEDPSGTFYARYTNGKMLKMDASQAKHARALFEKEVKSLVEVGVPQVDASSLQEQTVSAVAKKHNVRVPILEEEGEDENPDNYEQIFEEEYQGMLPDTIVGLQFETRNSVFKGQEVPLWEKVLMGLAQKQILAGVESARAIASLEKAENFSVSKSNDGCR